MVRPRREGVIRGQARRRGTFEERKSQSIQQRQARLDAFEVQKQLRWEQEVAAYRTMVWWQLEMSVDRYRRATGRRYHTQSILAAALAISSIYR